MRFTITNLTKSNSPFVNTIFGVTLLASLFSFLIRPLFAWVQHTDMASASATSIVSLALWFVILGVYRLVKGAIDESSSHRSGGN
jgi:predicted PurR-regulated permease PerM